MHIIECTPASPGLFSVSINGRPMVSSSPVPFCETARQLLREGADSESWASCRHAGSAAESFRAKLGILAKLTVGSEHGRPRLRPWRASKPSGAASPIAQKGEVGPSTGAAYDAVPVEG
jgi:hypothetical protein